MHTDSTMISTDRDSCSLAKATHGVSHGLNSGIAGKDSGGGIQAGNKTNGSPSVGAATYISLGAEELGDAPSHTGDRLVASLGTLWRRLLPWFPHLGLRSILLHLGSCYRRIRLERKLGLDTSGLAFDQVRESVPKVFFPHNCSVERACILSIQALEKARPYLRPADSELFAQAWFQATRYYDRNVGRELCTKEPSEYAPPLGERRNVRPR